MGAQEDFEHLKDMADRLFGDDEDAKDGYVTKHMKQLGYRMRAVFEDPEPDENSGGGNDFTSGLFGGNRQRREVRDVREQRSRRQSGGGFGTSQYGS